MRPERLPHLLIFSCKSWTGFCRDVDAERRWEKSFWASTVRRLSWSCRQRMVSSIP